MLIVVTLIKVSHSREKGQSEVLNYFVLTPLLSAVLRLHISVHKKIQSYNAHKHARAKAKVGFGW